MHTVSLGLNTHRSCSCALQFIWSNSGDGGTSTALVWNPVQRVFGSILTIAPKTTPGNKKVFIKNKICYFETYTNLELILNLRVRFWVYIWPKCTCYMCQNGKQQMNFYHKYCNVTTFSPRALPLNNGLVSWISWMVIPPWSSDQCMWRQCTRRSWGLQLQHIAHPTA
jgi:hypothetical protein